MSTHTKNTTFDRIDRIDVQGSDGEYTFCAHLSGDNETIIVEGLTAAEIGGYGRFQTAVLRRAGVWFQDSWYLSRRGLGRRRWQEDIADLMTRGAGA